MLGSVYYSGGFRCYVGRLSKKEREKEKKKKKEKKSGGGGGAGEGFSRRLGHIHTDTIILLFQGFGHEFFFVSALVCDSRNWNSR